jgi:FHS family L-fucose permease-like MFS transporter
VTASENRKRSLLGFAAVTSLFFAWGFITSNNDPLIVALRAAFRLDYSEALLTQIVFFLAYGLLSLPAAWFSSRVGSVDTILGSLALMACGCLAVVVSTNVGSFWPILAALFVLAAGRPSRCRQCFRGGLGLEGRHFRLASLRRSIPWEWCSASILIGGHAWRPGASPWRCATCPGRRDELLAAVNYAFLIMAALLGVQLVMLLSVRRSIIAVGGNYHQEPSRLFGAVGSRWAVLGATAIGLYVGAEVSIGSIMINFLNQRQVLGLPLEDAGRYLANFYWGGALAGRLVGTALLTRIRAARLLATCGIVATLLCATVLVSSGPISGYAALAIGFFNSIMFPTIFSITLERSGVSQSSTSGLLCVAIFGGALLPMAVGAIADRFGLGVSFAIPLGAYAFIAVFALAAGSRLFASPEPAANASPIP